MNPRVLLVLLLLAVAGGAFFAGFMISGSNPFRVIDSDARDCAELVKVEVVDTGETFTFDLDDPLTKVLYYSDAGYALATSSWAKVDWQIALGQEDKPRDGAQGDSCDVILKIWKLEDGDVKFECACLGGYQKKVYYDGALVLDSATSRWAAWNG